MQVEWGINLVCSNDHLCDSHLDVLKITETANGTIPTWVLPDGNISPDVSKDLATLSQCPVALQHALASCHHCYAQILLLHTGQLSHERQFPSRIVKTGNRQRRIDKNSFLTQ